MVRAPGLDPSVVAHPVTLLDVAPTLLDLFGLETPGGMRGLTLVGAARGGALPARLIPIESGIGLQAIVRPDGLKLIADTKASTFEAYDLAADPDELVDLVAAGRIPPDARAELDAFFAR
jgi:arylsulfatase A-like enzyme